MGTDCRAYLKGHVTQEEILNFIRQRFYINATMDINKVVYGKVDNYDDIQAMYDNSNIVTSEQGFIDFIDVNGDVRKLFYLYNNHNYYENKEYYKERNLIDMVTSEKTYLSLGYWGNAVEIMKQLVTEFGGWIDENDCDDITFYPIKKQSDTSIKPVIKVTMEDIYNKFGGIVVITK